MIRETIIRKIVEIDVAGGSLLEESIQASDELLHASAVNELDPGKRLSNTRASARTTFGRLSRLDAGADQIPTSATLCDRIRPRGHGEPQSRSGSLRRDNSVVLVVGVRHLPKPASI